MSIPFERFGSCFVRLRFDEPFHLISLTGGLELTASIHIEKLKHRLKPEAYSTSHFISECRRLKREMQESISAPTSPAPSKFISSLPIVQAVLSLSPQRKKKQIQHVPTIHASASFPTLDFNKPLTDEEIDSLNSQWMPEHPTPPLPRLPEPLPLPLTYQVRFKLFNAGLDYIRNDTPRSQWFRALFNLIKDCKCDYQYSKQTNITFFENSESTTTGLTFTVIFDDIDSFDEFLSYKLSFWDCCESYYYDYIPVRHFNRVFLIEVGNYVIHSSFLDLDLSIIATNDPNVSQSPYFAVIKYQNLEKAENFINEFIMLLQRFNENQVVQYTHDEEDKNIVVSNLKCELKIDQSNHFMKYKTIIKPELLILTAALMCKHDMIELDNID